jgi:bifunctional DNA-binding transcriptional regulator/antitoxin component of YhaV-PrlF toxin-antitoxin module
MERFQTTLREGEGRGSLVEVPFDVKATYGKARAPVRGRVNGTEFQTTVAVYGGRYYLGFRKEVRERAGIAPGDPLTIELELDDQPREVELPRELAAALDAAPDAREAYEGLSYTHRREYAEWVGGAKREETRQRRLEKAVSMLREGAKHP